MPHLRLKAEPELELLFKSVAAFSPSNKKQQAEVG